MTFQIYGHTERARDTVSILNALSGRMKKDWGKKRSWQLARLLKRRFRWCFTLLQTNKLLTSQNFPSNLKTYFSKSYCCFKLIKVNVSYFCIFIDVWHHLNSHWNAAVIGMIFFFHTYHQYRVLICYSVFCCLSGQRFFSSFSSFVDGGYRTQFDVWFTNYWHMT